jgi:hypothetical protein
MDLSQLLNLIRFAIVRPYNQAIILFIHLVMKAKNLFDQLPLVAAVSNLQLSVDLLRYPTFYARLPSLHKSYVRTTNQLTPS